MNGPDWLDTQRFDIVAKAAGQSTEDQLRIMTETLLADRFKVALHRTTKETQAYVLVIGKGGSKLIESKTEGESELQPDQARMQLTILRTPLSSLTDMLYGILRTPVVDETGLKGKYDVSINMMKYVSMGSDGGSIDPGRTDHDGIAGRVGSQAGIAQSSARLTHRRSRRKNCERELAAVTPI